MKENFPKCFKPDYEDSILSLTVPRFSLKNPHKSYNRVAPGLNIKDTTQGGD